MDNYWKAKPKESLPDKGKKEKISADVDNNLLSELKALRRTIADEKNVPAYIVFSDAALMDMCRKLPETEEAFLEVSGVGKVKLQLYGESFLQVIKTRKFKDE